MLQRSLILRGRCEDYLMEYCINPALYNINEHVNFLREISTNDIFMKYSVKRIDFEHYCNELMTTDQNFINDYWPHLFFPYKKLSL